MAIDQIARAMAAQAGGGGTGGFDIGSGLEKTDTDPPVLNNTGVLDIESTEDDTDAEIGTFKVKFKDEDDDKVIQVKGFNTAGTKSVDTELDDETTQSGLPSSEAVKTYLEGYGNTIRLSMNASTYVLTVQLKHGDDVISYSTVDLPIESMVVSARYDADTKKLILVLQSGQEIEVPVSQLISGLVPDSRKIAGIDLADDITKTELQTALNVEDGANKTVIDTSISSSSTDTNVPSSKAVYTELSRTVKKAQIVPVESTANVVTVPSDSVGDYSAIAKIGGKTEKSKNLLIYPYNTTQNPFVAYAVTYNVNASKEITINAAELPTATAYFDIRRKNEGDVLHLKVGKTYTISYVCTGTGSCWLYFASQGATNNTYVSKTISEATNGEKVTFTYTRPENYEGEQIFVAVRSSDTLPTNLKVTLQIEEGPEATAYEPYFEGLHSAPVDKIVSVGRNLWDGRFYDLIVDITDSYKIIDNSDTTYTAIIPCKPNTTYTLSKTGGSRFRIHTTSEFPKINDYALRQVVNNNSLTTYTFTTASNENYIMFYTGFNTDVVTDVIIKDDSVKTTISIPQSIKNLPDYGCSAGDVYNYIDFERGVYVHQVTEIKGSDTTWTTSSNGFTASISNIKLGTRASSVICPLYDDVVGEDFDPNWDRVIYASGITAGAVNCIDKTETLATFTSKIADVSIVYELNTPEEIPLSNFIPIIKSEPNGTIEFQNEHNLAVPNKVLYKKEVL